MSKFKLAERTATHWESNPVPSEMCNDDDDITTSHCIFSTFFYLLPLSPSGTFGVSCIQSQLGAATVLSLLPIGLSSVLHLFLALLTMLSVQTYINAECPFTDIGIPSQVR